MSVYSIYGITIRSTLPFRSPLRPSTNSPTLHITEQYRPVSLVGSRLLVTIPEGHWNLAAPQAIYRFDHGDILQYPDGCQILVYPEQMVYVHGNNEIRADIMDVRLLGVSFAWWLLCQGRIPFHAGAIVVDGQAIMFSAEGGTGKSSLMCSLLQKGIPLLSDDFVAVHLSSDQNLIASSAYPQMRLWPTAVKQFVGDPEDHPPVIDGAVKRRIRVGEKWGTFLEGTFPVSRMYLLHRRKEKEGPIELTQLSGHDLFMQLLTAITMGAVFPITDFHDVWGLLLALLQEVPIYTLSYPSGWQWLPKLHEIVLNHNSHPN